jgi:predicted  nucleic acid-binding Zn-ribbon protein
VIPLAFFLNRLYNSIMSQSSNLFRLQQIDSAIDQSHTRLHDIETALSSNPALQLAEERASTAEHTLQDAQKALRKTEEAVQDQRIKINQTESVFYGGKVHNPKELQDLQNDVAALKRYMSVLEDRQLEAMLILEDAEIAFKQATIQVDETLANTTEQQAGLRGELAQVRKTVERLVLERQAATTALNLDDLDLYEQLRKTRRGVAVAKVSSQTCGACGSLLTPAVLQAVYSPSQLIRCTSCGRILYAG